MLCKTWRLAVEDVYDDSFEFELGKGKILNEGSKIAIIATGLMVQEALKVYDLMEVKPTIVDMYSIKPIDTKLIKELAKSHDRIITIEEHNIIGGLGSAVAEVLAEEDTRACLTRIGMNDEFGRSGKPKDLLKYYGLDADSILEKIK